MGGGLIIEGVTGAGKSRTLDALSRAEARPDWLRHAQVLTEDETLGELMDEEMKDASLTDEQRCFRLHTAVRRIDRAFADSAAAGFVLERFHFTHFVFMPRWELYADIDQHLADFGFRSVLLTLPETQVEHRALRRVDREGTEWVADMTAHFGSAAGAIDAIAESQRTRLRCLALTRLPTLVLDTTDRDWDRYAAEIAAFCRERGPTPRRA